MSSPSIDFSLQPSADSSSTASRQLHNPLLANHIFDRPPYLSRFNILKFARFQLHLLHFGIMRVIYCSWGNRGVDRLHLNILQNILNLVNSICMHDANILLLVMKYENMWLKCLRSC